SEGLSTESPELGFTSMDHKVNYLELELRNLEGRVAYKKDVEKIGKQLEDFIHQFSYNVMGHHILPNQPQLNHTHINQGGSSGQSNRQTSQGGSANMTNPNTNTLQACDMIPKVE
ncbi:hypothetical protein KI387_019837, partial [Taxus chinensis]